MQFQIVASSNLPNISASIYRGTAPITNSTNLTNLTNLATDTLNQEIVLSNLNTSLWSFSQTSGTNGLTITMNVIDTPGSNTFYYAGRVIISSSTTITYANIRFYAIKIKS